MTDQGFGKFRCIVQSGVRYHDADGEPIMLGVNYDDVVTGQVGLVKGVKVLAVRRQGEILYLRYNSNNNDPTPQFERVGTKNKNVPAKKPIRRKSSKGRVPNAYITTKSPNIVPNIVVQSPKKTNDKTNTQQLGQYNVSQVYTPRENTASSGARLQAQNAGPPIEIITNRQKTIDLARCSGIIPLTLSGTSGITLFNRALRQFNMCQKIIDGAIESVCIGAKKVKQSYSPTFVRHVNTGGSTGRLAALQPNNCATAALICAVALLLEELRPQQEGLQAKVMSLAKAVPAQGRVDNNYLKKLAVITNNLAHSVLPYNYGSGGGVLTNSEKYFGPWNDIYWAARPENILSHNSTVNYITIFGKLPAPQSGWASLHHFLVIYSLAMQEHESVIIVDAWAGNKGSRCAWVRMMDAKAFFKIIMEIDGKYLNNMAAAELNNLNKKMNICFNIPFSRHQYRGAFNTFLPSKYVGLKFLNLPLSYYFKQFANRDPLRPGIKQVIRDILKGIKDGLRLQVQGGGRKSRKRSRKHKRKRSRKHKRKHKRKRRRKHTRKRT